MRLVTHETRWGPRAGLVLEDRCIDAHAAAQRAGLATDGDARWTSTRTILGAGSEAIARLAEAAFSMAASIDGDGPDGRLASMRLGPPVPDPDKIVCLGLNYRDHAEEANLALPAAPMLFAKFRNSLVGPTDTIVLPSHSDAVDYEAELAVVIGKPGKDVEEKDALEYVAGAMALNDVSARDLQNATSQWMAGKAIDTFAPCGPSLVLMDEIEDLQDLSIATRVNGQTVQDANTSLMIFSVAQIVAFISRLMTLVPGDIIATGTPAGVGFKRDPQVLLSPGDVVEVEIGGIGTLRNPVSPPAIDGNQPVAVATQAHDHQREEAS